MKLNIPNLICYLKKQLHTVFLECLTFNFYEYARIVQYIDIVEKSQRRLTNVLLASFNQLIIACRNHLKLKLNREEE